MYFDFKCSGASVHWRPSLGIPACRRSGTSVMSRRYLNIQNFFGNWRKSLNFGGIRHLEFKIFLGAPPDPRKMYPPSLIPWLRAWSICILTEAAGEVNIMTIDIDEAGVIICLFQIFSLSNGVHDQNSTFSYSLDLTWGTDYFKRKITKDRLLKSSTTWHHPVTHERFWIKQSVVWILRPLLFLSVLDLFAVVESENYERFQSPFHRQLPAVWQRSTSES